MYKYLHFKTRCDLRPHFLARLVVLKCRERCYLLVSVNKNYICIRPPLFVYVCLQVVANAVAAISEILETSQSAHNLLEMNTQTINKLLTALNECTEWGQVFILDAISNYTPKEEREAQRLVQWDLGLKTTQGQGQSSLKFWGGLCFEMIYHCCVTFCWPMGGGGVLTLGWSYFCHGLKARIYCTKQEVSVLYCHWVCSQWKYPSRPWITRLAQFMLSISPCFHI